MFESKVVFAGLAVMMFAACGSFTAANKSGSHDFSDRVEPSAKELAIATDVAAQLTKNTWCLVEEIGQPFREDAAAGYAYGKDGSLVLRALSRENGDKSNALSDKRSPGTWTFDNGTMTLRDQSNGGVFATHLEVVRYTPPAKGPALWLTGVSGGEQSCLKSIDLKDPSKYWIHCKCDLDQIKAQAQKN